MAMILTFGYASESFTGDVLKQYVSRNNLFVIISGSKVFIAGCGQISDAFIGDLYLHSDLALFHFSFITRSQQMGTSTIKITGICLLVRCCRVISTFHWGKWRHTKGRHPGWLASSYAAFSCSPVNYTSPNTSGQNPPTRLNLLRGTCCYRNWLS